MTGHSSLRDLVAGDRIVVAPGAYDMLSALLVEQAGFSCIYLTGNGQAASTLGLPDLGLMTLSEMAERVRRTAACTSLPLIADADVGYGSLLSVQRAVREFESAGASAIQLEDQASPKKCGHELGRELVAVEEMVARLRAAVDARTSAELLVVARTDARTTLGLEEAIRRGRAYLDAGADVIFVESPESEEELAEVARAIPGPTLANMVETGRTPYLSWQRLGELGFKVAIYPGSAFLAAAGGVRAVLTEIRDRGRAEDSLARMLTLREYHDLLRFEELLEVEQGYRALRQPAGAQT